MLTRAQEAIVVNLCRTLSLPVDDLCAVTRELPNEGVSRSDLSRCVRRHGVGDFAALKLKTPASVRKSSNSDLPGFVHMDIKYLARMAGHTSRSYIFLKIDRATR